MPTTRKRGTAYTGRGYGTLRYMLQQNAKRRIEVSLREGYYCEAITIIESFMSERLESRLSFLTGTNIGFCTLGKLVTELRKFEVEPELLGLLDEINEWRSKRNLAVHELVKVEELKELAGWNQRMKQVANTANDGYSLLQCIYHSVRRLNPKHPDDIFA